MPSEVFQFHYVTSPTGELSGHSFVVQTEDAINALGQYAYDSTADSTEALRVANQAFSAAETASNNASSAVTTANSALSQVRTLKTTVDSWNARIQTAEANSSTAVSTANSALASAQDAVSTANTASTNASNAVATSNSAIETASAASLSATQAVQTANSASSTAQSALEVAQQARIDAAADISTMQGLVQNATDQATEAKTAAQNAAQSASESSDFSDLSEQWATKTDNTAAEGEPADYTVDGTGFSAKWNANLAQAWAVKMEGMVTDDGTPEGTAVDYSSKYYAQQASQSASSASSSASAAASSESNAASSASAASTSAGQASSSAAAAASSASAASVSATAAQQAQIAATAAQDSVELAQKWATWMGSEGDPDQTVDGTEYSAKYYAEQAANTLSEAVKVTAQTLTDEQKQQARENIGAQSETYSTSGGIERLITDRLNDYVSVKDFGAKGDGDTDDTDAFISASEAGFFNAVGGNFVCKPRNENAAELLESLQKIRVSNSVKIDLPAGRIDLSDALIVSGSHDVEITGVTTQVTLQSCSGVESGSTIVEIYAGDFRSVSWYKATYQISDASLVDVGDFIGVPLSDGHESHAGLFEVIAVDGSSVTVFSTNQMPPTQGDVGVLATVFKTVIFGSGGATTFLFQQCNGFSIRQCCFIGTASLVDMGDNRGPQNIDAVGGKGVTGVISRDGSDVYLTSCAIYGFSGSNAFSNDNGQLNLTDCFVSMSSRQGIGAAASVTNCTNSISSGNVLDGAVAQNSAGLFGSLVTTGNFRHGVIVSGCSSANLSSLSSEFNTDSGVVSTGSSLFLCSNCKVKNNSEKGIWSYAFGSVVCVGAQISDNLVGVEADTGAIVNCGSSAFTGNTRMS